MAPQTYASYAGAAQKAAAGADPSLTNIGAARVKAILAQALGRMPAPQTPEQIATEAGGFVNPQIQAQIDQLTADINGRVASGQTSITDYTKAAQTQLGNEPDKVAKMYGAAEQARAAITQALQGDAAAGGAPVTGELAAKLREINAPEQATTVGNAEALTGNIAGGAGLRGATDLNRLVDQAKAEGTYALGIPGIIGLEGGASSRLLGEQGLADLAKGATDIRTSGAGKIADVAQALTAADQSNRGDRAKLYADLYGQLLNLDTQRGIAREGYGVDVAKIGAGVDVATSRITAASKAAAAKAQESDTKAYQKAYEQASTKLGELRTVFMQGAPNHVTQPKTDAFGKVVTGPDGNPIVASTTVYKRVPYYEAIRMAEQAIAPYLSPYATAADIVKMAQQFVNPLYPAGQYGRPGTGAPPAAQDTHRHGG